MNAKNAWEPFFVILPYVSLTIFLVGHVWRYRFDQFGWTHAQPAVREEDSARPPPSHERCWPSGGTRSDC